MLALPLPSIDYRGGLTPASYPAPGEIWRVTVRRREAGRVLLEAITLGMYDTTTQPIADDWAVRIHTSGLGTVFAAPVVSESAAAFVVQMRFDSSMLLAPASAIVAQWEDTIANAEVVVVERVNVSKATGLMAETDVGDALAYEYERKVRADAEPNVVERFLGELKGAGQLLTVVIIGGVVVVLVFAASAARKAATS